jgi:hypothetical protein
MMTRNRKHFSALGRATWHGAALLGMLLAGAASAAPTVAAPASVETAAADGVIRVRSA